MEAHESVSRAKPKDAVRLSLVDRAPASIEPYLRLARIDRPIGSWLLFWPCAFGVALSWPFATAPYSGSYLQVGLLLVLFALGSVAMRGAGCTWNDIADRHIDAKVERTRGRPLPSGRISVFQAFVFLGLLLLIGLGVLLMLRREAQIVALSSVALIGLYPFLKRVTHFPQVGLGLVFNWGVLVAVAELTGGISTAALLLYAGCVLWTVGYDTIYAHQDREDDLVAGVKSTALYFGEHSRFAVGVLYVAAFVAISASAALALPVWTLAALAPAGVQLGAQVMRLDIAQPDLCLRLFRANRDTGFLIFAGLLAGALIPTGGLP